MESSCLDLALEGERLCKAGDYRAGVSFFESAIQVGTEDLQILSAIYSQLGNAYFHLQEYIKALQYHRHDLTLTRTIGDELGEAKASGNLGNTLKLLGRFDEAVVCCQRHLDITGAIYDRVGQARALYNFGNVYHAKGKSICWAGAEPGGFPEDAKTALKKATQYYEANLSLVQEMADHAAQGRTYGNLGNTYYLLGDFEKAVSFHQQRLLIAKEFGDKSAERRGHCNLGNAHIFLGQFDVAADHYKRTLQLARLLKDRAVEAQACYSLGNTYTLLQDYERAIDYHLKHLIIAQDLNDRVGEGRACWSLGNAHTALGNHQQAVHFAEKHLEITKETGDKDGEMTAQMNLSDLRLVVGLKSSANLHPSSYTNANANSWALAASSQGYYTTPDPHSQTGPSEQDPQAPDEDILTKSSKNNNIMASTKQFLLHHLKSIKQKNSQSPPTEESSSAPESEGTSAQPGPHDAPGEDGFLDLLSRFQGSRMDDQRCSLDPPSPSPPGAHRTGVEAGEERGPQEPAEAGEERGPQEPAHFLELLAYSQDRRLDDQRVSIGHFPAPVSITDPPCSPPPHCRHLDSSAEPEGDDFFDMLVKCQGSRLDDQRCAAPPPTARGPTVPDEDFLSLILRSQANRMEEQRVAPPPGCSQSKPD
ncbi:hypothetical protein NHX12_033239 [Muraenolepis orangiensis]|uniref:Uncharacterized protein n=1 Tax=Muraenolepis orangiensis TaxID=630683 RepID=A0A9Q0IJG5_9TELE|nr:hypothetical protein NHX12_033239 [Muraenolepis orangiensis]